MAIKIKPLLGILPRGGHPLARRLAGAWLFNEGRGNRLWDVSGERHTGTLTDMDPATDWVAGPHGYALAFDGTNDRVIVGPEAGINLGTANACVVRYKHVTIGLDVLVGHKSQADGGYFLAFSSANIYYAASGSYVGVAHGIIAGDEVWLGVSRQGTSVTFYKNGVQLATVQTLGANNDLRLSTIGSYWSGSSTYSANMRCDYAYCWSRPLSTGEMAWLYRDPFCFLMRPGATPLLGFHGQIHNVSGSAGAVSSASGTATAISAGEQPAGTPWPRVTLGIDASWRKEALLNGMTDVAVKLGTVLTQGWFWTRRAGCSAVYRGADRVDAQAGVLVCVAPADVEQIALPAYLSHEAGTGETSFAPTVYIVRRFNSCGQQDHTTGASITVRIGSDGRLAAPGPNSIFNLKTGQVAGDRIEITWLYCPLDQKAAPQVFNIYWDGGTGEIDFVNPISVLRHEGRKFYRYESQSLENGRYLFAVRAESMADVESSPQAIAGCEVNGSVPGQSTVLSVEAI